MTAIRLTATRVADTELYTVNLPETCVIRSSGAPLFGLSKDVARRVAASFNTLADYPIEEIEAGVVQAEHDSLEYACEKIRLLEIVAHGCPEHRWYRGEEDYPGQMRACPTCEGIKAAVKALAEMSARTPSEPSIPYEEYMKERVEWAEVTSQEPGMHQVSIRNQRKSLVEEKPQKGVPTDG